MNFKGTIPLNRIKAFFQEYLSDVRANKKPSLSELDFSDFSSITNKDTCPSCECNFSSDDWSVEYEFIKKSYGYKVSFLCNECSKSGYDAMVIIDEEDNREGFNFDTELMLSLIDYEVKIKGYNRLKKYEEELKEYLYVNDLPTNMNLKGENSMNTNKMFKGFDFGVLQSEVVRVSHLGLAVKNSTGTFVSYDKDNKELVDVDLFDIDLKDMIYKMPVALKDIATGDAIIHNSNIMLVTSAGEKLTVVDVSAGEEKIILPTKSLFGFNFYTKVVSLIDFSGAGASGDSPFGNMLPLLLMQGKGSGDGNKSNLMPLMMMSMMNKDGKNDMFSNPMMMMALMGDGNMGDMLPLMMMMGDNNPFAPKKKVEAKDE